PTEDAAIVETRDRVRRALIATLLLSQGTPMLLMGDEIGRSQAGNNNGYCQDDPINWLSWEAEEPRERDFHEFLRCLVIIRRTRRLLRQRHFLHGKPSAHGRPDVEWLRPDGAGMQQADWDNPRTASFALRLN